MTVMVAGSLSGSFRREIPQIGTDSGSVGSGTSKNGRIVRFVQQTMPVVIGAILDPNLVRGSW